MLGQERVVAGLVRRNEHRRLVTQALALLDHPRYPAGDRGRQFERGAQQLIEVARALVADARVIVFDEPTSSADRARRRAAVRDHRPVTHQEG